MVSNDKVSCRNKFENSTVETKEKFIYRYILVPL